MADETQRIDQNVPGSKGDGTLVSDGSGSETTPESFLGSDREYKSIFDASIDGLIVIAPEGIVVEANPAACQMHGYRHDEFVGMDPRQFIHRDDHHLFDEFVQTVLANRPFRAVARDLRPDGTIFDVEVHGSLIMFHDKPHLLAVIRDVTDREKAQERLTTSEELFRTIFETEPACVKLLDSAGNLIDMNPAGLEMIEADSIEQVQGQSILNIIDPKDRDDFVAASDAVFRGESKTLQFAIVGVKGTRHWMESHEVPLRDSQGKVKALLAVTQDITERDRAERMLASRNQVLEHLAKGASLQEILETLVQTIEEVGQDMIASVLLLDEDANCLRHGAAPNLPDFYNEAVDGIQVGPCAGSCGAAAYTGQRVVVEDVMTHPNWVEYRDLAKQVGLGACWSQPIFSANGQTLGTFATYYREPRSPTAIDLELIDSAADLAAVAIDHKRAEEELQKAHDELELRVQQRTEELASSNAALEESNRELQQFAYVASHDLQEPLRMVASYCELLKRRYHDQLDDEANEFVNFAVDGAARMQNLIQDLLAYSRLQTEDRPFEETDCGALVDDAIKNLAVSIQAAGASVTHDPLPTVSGSPWQLSEVFQNLIDNGIKYRGAEPPHVHVSAEQTDGQWVFSVRDNGIGIDAKHVDRIFAVFKRLHSHDQFPGTGIGLAICKRAVDRHGGQLWVESQLGKGSTFHFTIPAC